MFSLVNNKSEVDEANTWKEILSTIYQSVKDLIEIENSLYPTIVLHSTL